MSFGYPGMAHLHEEIQHRVEQIILIKKKATLTYNVRLESVACLEFAFSANTRTLFHNQNRKLSLLLRPLLYAVMIVSNTVKQ